MTEKERELRHQRTIRRAEENQKMLRETLGIINECRIMINQIKKEREAYESKNPIRPSS